MRKTDIERLVNDQSKICVSIILPAHPETHERKLDEGLLRDIVHETEKLLPEGNEEAGHLRENLAEVVKGIDLIHAKQGLGLFVSAATQMVVKFPFPVQRKVVVNKCFAPADVLCLSNYSAEYYVLELNEKVARLFKGVVEELEEVRGAGFPIRYDQLYEYSSPSRGSSFVGEANLKAFEKDKSIMDQIRVKSFFHEVDDLLKAHLSKDSLLIVTGVEKEIFLFTRLTRHSSNLGGSVHGNYTYLSTSELADLIWPLALTYRRKQASAMITILREKIGEGLAVPGLGETAVAAAAGRGWKLLIERDFCDQQKADLTAAGFEESTDGVNEVVQTILKMKGEVIVVDNDALKEFGRIALITRY